jgi:hypothetical protein
MRPTSSGACKIRMDDLDLELAREEHRRGVPVGVSPKHCGRCRRVHRDLLRARCPHDQETVDMSTLTEKRLICLQCGARING